MALGCARSKRKLPLDEPRPAPTTASTACPPIAVTPFKVSPAFNGGTMVVSFRRVQAALCSGDIKQVCIRRPALPAFVDHSAHRSEPLYAAIGGAAQFLPEYVGI